MVKLGSKEYYVWPWRVLVVLLIFLPNQSLHGDHIDSIQAKPFEIFLKKKFEAGHIFQFVSGLITKKCQPNQKVAKIATLVQKGRKKSELFSIVCFFAFLFLFLFLCLFSLTHKKVFV